MSLSISVRASSGVIETRRLSFSVHPRCSLCLCGEPQHTHHRDTEFTEIAQRIARASDVDRILLNKLEGS
jgi:hypothetical protein